MLAVILLSVVLLSSAHPQGSKTISTDPVCVALQERALDDLLNNPPVVSDPIKFLECLPRKLIRQYTEKEAPYFGITYNCLATPNSEECNSKGRGYQIIADSLRAYFRMSNRCLDCSNNNPNIDYAISLLQRRHPRLLQKGLLILTEQT